MHEGAIRRRSELIPGTLEMLRLGTRRRGAERRHDIGYEIRALSAGTITVVSGSLYPNRDIHAANYIREFFRPVGSERSKQ